MTLYGYKYGSSTLQLNIIPLDNKQDEVNKIIKINVVRSEKQLFDALQIAFTVFFLFTVGLGMPLSIYLNFLKKTLYNISSIVKIKKYTFKLKYFYIKL